ncbi:hypothetical protein [Paraburkholderia caledonica]|uniref:hypothetical protein n=1 Tax=Paraburkholderia caledonica TaxID=134536 RepID=UPI0011775365|nr:hypothetical protein [Paraburkholderia caledonica]
MQCYTGYAWASDSPIRDKWHDAPQETISPITCTIHIPPTRRPICAQASLTRFSFTGVAFIWEAKTFVSGYTFHSGAGHQHHSFREDEDTSVAMLNQGLEIDSVDFTLILRTSVNLSGFAEAGYTVWVIE